MSGRGALALAALFALLAVPAAAAHEEGAHMGFASVVSTIDPPVHGLLVQVIGGHEHLSVTNLTKQDVVIFDAQGEPVARIAPGDTEVWREPRVGADEEPPDREGLVRNWRIPGEADGEPFEIVGFLGYRPPGGGAEEVAAEPRAGAERELPGWVVPAAAAGGALLLALAVGVPFLRRREQE